MNSRKQFEANYLLKYGESDVAVGLEWLSTKPDGSYRYEGPRAEWEIWQVSRACATPEWEHAPGWASWLAMNPDGHWYWFAAQPELRLAQWWNPWGTQVRDAGLTPGRTGWTETLEPRPWSN